MQTSTANLAPTVVYVLFWVGLPFARACIFGDVFRAVQPVARDRPRGAAGSSKRLGAAGAEPLAYPTWLGRWPAAVGILAFAWVELVYVNKDDPSTLSI